MKKNEINAKLREFVKMKLSPSPDERSFVSEVYNSVKEALGSKCIQIGSFPRYTAIRPLHDLDILYVIGDWDEAEHSPKQVLELLFQKMRTSYKAPTGYRIELALQSHSITISFYRTTNKVFSVDIVPAYVFSKNEFNDDLYMVPEVLKKKAGIERETFYQTLINEKREMGWLLSDPRGYITEARRINEVNEDFRRVVKFVKAWKNAFTESHKDIKLKSFHLEQLITIYFKGNRNTDIFDGIFNFFVNLPNNLESPRVKDRANNNKFIDEYLSELTAWQKEKIEKARDGFLIKLEEVSANGEIESLLEILSYKRASRSEKFLFDFGIPILLDNSYSFQIGGHVLPREGGFREFFLDKIGKIKVDRKIEFRIKGTQPTVDLLKWKVKNDNTCEDPRGEITDHRTLRDPERTKYSGNHFVECYAIKDNICVAKARQNVMLEWNH